MGDNGNPVIWSCSYVAARLVNYWRRLLETLHRLCQMNCQVSFGFQYQRGRVSVHDYPRRHVVLAAATLGLHKLSTSLLIYISHI
ncbi:hypothetical protein HBI56_088710 [Parastagonospora nodorum]|uniref:Uncharacterized protein n=1 Tax=Phaeosphaeria nodorum (strain SN15 / ATCC MYA-4574 / FGSC 10173) TaxID=321614 RepID=A0A7U2I697_PHANO|nr:hypothetical protein HBH56_110760 [Parastagonospora nodorum]QRD03365.1 hypothetical protein JI435_419410 [Parastagonospora nodorum SN15]KAH3925567.1 hypothetical protein HBH54_179580 [Parastagonospora nodorum]KAH3951077.1 hypothetical protein HBH53_066450 [Parastagonospora nodorum]KAH3974281.1 hypothetical protein HBH51_091790 [Parastagonospora nodorum]